MSPPCQQRLGEMLNVWMARNSEEVQGYADHNGTKNFFDAVNAIYDPKTKGTSLFLSSDGSALLTEKPQISKRCVEHFRGVLNRPYAISDAAIGRLPQVETNVALNLPSFLPETIRAVQQLAGGKAPEFNGVPAEINKHGGHRLMDQMTTLFQM
nr:unnamed protein product [Spirometra erinaceieuropaei]